MAFPNPDTCKEVFNNVQVIKMPQLIDLKLASYRSGPLQRSQNLADVVKLIESRKLNRSYVNESNPSVRADFEKIIDGLAKERKPVKHEHSLSEHVVDDLSHVTPHRCSSPDHRCLYRDLLWHCSVAASFRLFCLFSSRREIGLSTSTFLSSGERLPSLLFTFVRRTYSEHCRSSIHLRRVTRWSKHRWRSSLLVGIDGTRRWECLSIVLRRGSAINVNTPSQPSSGVRQSIRSFIGNSTVDLLQYRRILCLIWVLGRVIEVDWMFVWIVSMMGSTNCPSRQDLFRHTFVLYRRSNRFYDQLRSATDTETPIVEIIMQTPSLSIPHYIWRRYSHSLLRSAAGSQYERIQWFYARVSIKLQLHGGRTASL